MNGVVGSVVVPAHQEEAVIARCLDALLDGPNDLEVVVVVNGSTDATAEVARSVPVREGHHVTVLDLAEGGKPAALNAGDRVAVAFPRLYVDADVVCSNEAVASTCAVLGDEVLAASPRLTYEFAGVPWAVAAYTDVWLRLHLTPQLIGSGVYGVNAAGRGRFDRFPDAIADDAFVRSRFAPRERRNVEASFVAFPPRRTWSLVKRKSRVFLGHLELERGGASLRQLEHNMTPFELLRAEDRPPLTSLAAYALITVAAKARAAWQLRRGRTDVWERDETTR